MILSDLGIVLYLQYNLCYKTILEPRKTVTVECIEVYYNVTWLFITVTIILRLHFSKMMARPSMSWMLYCSMK